LKADLKPAIFVLQKFHQLAKIAAGQMVATGNE
jgi:hypothetical protein